MGSKKFTPKGKAAKLNDGEESEVRHPYIFTTPEGKTYGAGSSRLSSLPRRTRYALENQIDKDMGLKPESRGLKDARKALSTAANILSPATRLAVTALEPVTNSRKYARQRFLEKKAAEQHYDNSKTDVRVGVDHDLLWSKLDRDFLQDFFFRQNPVLFKKVRSDGRKNLTDEEFEEEKAGLFDALTTDKNLRMDLIDWIDKKSRLDGHKQVDGTYIPSFGQVECEFFGLNAKDVSIFHRNPTEDAVMRGFDPTVRGAARKGVVLENSVENNKILIRNICVPPESLNCTIKIPRVDKDGRKLPMRDAKGNLLHGNFDVVVIRGGKPAMIVNGERGESRIANMADMLGQLEKPTSEMSAAESSITSTSEMRGAAGRGASASEMQAATRGYRGSTSEMRGAAGRGASASEMQAATRGSRGSASGMRAAGDSFRAPTGVFSRTGMQAAGVTSVTPDVTPAPAPAGTQKGKTR